jgi:hypothetical protein
MRRSGVIKYSGAGLPVTVVWIGPAIEIAKGARNRVSCIY